MSKSHIHVVCLHGLAVAFLVAAPQTAWTQNQTTPDSESNPFLNDARLYVMELEPGRGRFQLREKSLLNWTNPVRQKERGAMYVWTHQGRPAAIGTLFTYQMNDKVHTKHELHSLAAVPFRATFEGSLAWTPKQPGLVWHDMADAPLPASTHVSRSLEMRQIARRFRTELVDPKQGKSELRLTPRPLVEYAALDQGVLDGAIFSFVFATDPEVLMLIEAFAEPRNGTPQQGYRYAFARCHHWQVAAYKDERMVWEAPQDLAHESNNLGNRENTVKIYNSFHPHPGVTGAVGGTAP